MSTVLLPPGDNPTAVNKYVNIKYSSKFYFFAVVQLILAVSDLVTAVTVLIH